MRWDRRRALLLAAVLLLLSIGQTQAHIREGDDGALVTAATSQELAARDVACGEDCHRRLAPQVVQDQETPPEFVPTHEWQDILPNQAIPPGLYIRVNLETGKKEAKLLD